MLKEAADIADNPGEAALRWATSNGIGPSFEAMDSADDDNVYLVTVTASDGSASKSQAVSITVTNREEPGSISLTQLLPQEGIAITARLSDQDGNITGTEWQWYRGDAIVGTFTLAAEGDAAHTTGTEIVSTLRVDGNNDGEITVADTGLVTHCEPTAADIAAGGPDGVTDNADDNEASATCAINGATSSTYIPTEDDDGKKLHARATYVDGIRHGRNSDRRLHRYCCA